MHCSLQGLHHIDIIYTCEHEATWISLRTLAHLKAAAPNGCNALCILFTTHTQPGLGFTKNTPSSKWKKYNKKQLNKFCNRKLGFRGYLRIIEWKFGYVKRKWSEEQVEWVECWEMLISQFPTQPACSFLSVVDKRISSCWSSSICLLRKMWYVVLSVSTYH